MITYSVIFSRNENHNKAHSEQKRILTDSLFSDQSIAKDKQAMEDWLHQKPDSTIHPKALFEI